MQDGLLLLALRAYVIFIEIDVCAELISAGFSIFPHPAADYRKSGKLFMFHTCDACFPDANFLAPRTKTILNRATWYSPLNQHIEQKEFIMDWDCIFWAGVQRRTFAMCIWSNGLMRWDEMRRTGIQFQWTKQAHKCLHSILIFGFMDFHFPFGPFHKKVTTVM